MTPFKTTLFAMLDAYVPQLLAGPEGRKPIPRAAVSVGVVPVVGVLGQSDWYADTNYSDIRRDIARAVADPSVKNIVLAVDSPGGSVIGLPETADAIREANKRKPVTAMVTGIAASAAYWLASQAGTIKMTPSGEAGSIGVLDISVDVSKALEDSGVKVTAVHAGEFKTERAPFAPLSDDAKAYMQKNVNAWYGDFLGAIRRGRGARVSANGNFGGGRMLPARDALAMGLVDFIGGVL